MVSARPLEIGGSELMLSTTILLQVWTLPLVGLLLFEPTALAGANTVAEGRSLYVNYCASCHGVNGDGDGPVALALSTPPANLRLLSERYGNPLPEDQIARFIDGRADVKAHGPRDMPVWGERVWKYPEDKGNKNQVKGDIAKLVAYLQSIQRAEQHASFK
jgi:mono/diheme cytochrome c family protein